MSNDPEYTVSGRDKRIVELIAQGKTNKEIASTIGLANASVNNALTQMYSRYGNKRVKLVRLFARLPIDI